jgi:competence protein ComFB
MKNPENEVYTDETEIDVHNFAEEMIEDHLLSTMKGENMCTCAKCRADVKAMALNRFPPMYVVSASGNAYATYQRLTAQNIANVIYAIMQGVVIVKNNPKH